jgi:hypothetical protein
LKEAARKVHAAGLATGYADKCLGNPASCRRSYVREEVLEQKFTELLGQRIASSEMLPNK